MPLGGKTLIEQVVDRLKQCISPAIQTLVVVTSHQSYPSLKSIFNNDPEVHVFAGSEENVLERFYKANLEFNQDIIIRATADNPFVSIDHIQSILHHHIVHRADLSHYLGLPLGSGVEVIKATALQLAYNHANTPWQFEHVTPYLYENRERFRVEEPVVEGRYNRPELRITIDEPEDFHLAEKIFSKLYRHRTNDFSLDQLIEFMDIENIVTEKQLLV